MGVIDNYRVLSDLTVIKDEKELFKYILKNLDSFVLIDNPLNVSECVYQIEDFYIGKTVNIKNRVSSHLVESLRVYDSNLFINKEKAYEIQNILKIKKLSIAVISLKQSDEEYLVKKLYKTLNLTNKEFVSEGMLEEKRYAQCKIFSKTNCKPELTPLGNRYFTASFTIGDKHVYRVAKTKEKALKSLETYLIPKFKRFKNKYSPVNKIKSNTNKKKRNKKVKIEDFFFVAIKKGRFPGIYNQDENWSEQILKFKMAEFKGFDDIDKARKYMRN